MPSLLNTRINFHPGWSGAFTEDQAEGAWPARTRVAKINSGPEDDQQDGALATVLGSVRAPDAEDRIFYFVEWDDCPRYAVGIVNTRLIEAPNA
jgi:hypothetical protein